MTGLLVKIDVRTGKRGEYYVYGIKGSDGVETTYTGFKKYNIETGHSIEYSYEINGAYRNLVDMKDTGIPAGQPVTAPVGGTRTYTPPDKRGFALRYAVDLIGHLLQAGKLTDKDIAEIQDIKMEIADQDIEWLNNENTGK